MILLGGRISLAASEHKWEPISEFCIKCGCSAQDYINGLRPTCTKTNNVKGISHLIYLKRLNGVTNESSQKSAS